MRVGLLGGTFDPVHRAHVRLACAARDRLALDRVLLAPVGLQPLKAEPPGAPFVDRVAMVERAIAGERALEISMLDAPRADGLPNYTADTLVRLRATLPEYAQIFLILGADAFAGLRRWRAPDEIVRMADLCVATRPGHVLPHGQDLVALLPESARLLGREHIAAAEASVFLCAGALLRLVELRDLDEDISATELRTDLPSGLRWEELPLGVASYIREHSLYGSCNVI